MPLLHLATGHTYRAAASSRKETIRHHLRHAGAEHEIFQEQTVNRLFDEARGVPRIINTLALGAMEAAAAAGTAKVTTEHLDKALRNLPQRKETPHHDPDTL